jgi:hypothetical protein
MKRMAIAALLMAACGSETSEPKSQPKTAPAVISDAAPAVISIDAAVPTVHLSPKGIVAADILGRKQAEVDARLGASGELDASVHLKGRAYMVGGDAGVPVLVEFDKDKAVVVRIYPRGGFSITDPNIDAILAWAGADRSSDWFPNADGESEAIYIWDREARLRLTPLLEETAKLRSDIIEGLSTFFTQTNVNATVRADGLELIFVAPKDECDRKTLQNFRKMLVSFELDPSRAFRTMKCDAGAVLKLR